MDWGSMVTVGRIIRPHGNKGHVIVLSETDFGDERFGVGSTLFAERDGRVVPVTITASRPHDGRWVIGIEAIGTMNDAETWRGIELRIPADAMKPLGPGAYYTHDLVGCVVRTTGGQTVGTVGRVDLDVGIPMLVVTEGSEEVLVPFTDAIIRTVTIGERTIEIEPPPGLLELNRRVPR
ncbi:MAG: ribosome maturation factor RimM [Acidobacteriota bacterium]